MMNKEILNKIRDEQDYFVRVGFEVICDSDTSIGEGKTIKERLLDYINQCTNVMNDALNYADHCHDIKPIKVELYDEDDNFVDVTDDINPNVLRNEINDKLKQLKRYIVEFNKQYKDLMECPDELPSCTRITEGKYLHTNEPRYGDPTYWIYPEGIEEKIEDDKKYKVWYTSKDAADPADSTTWNYVEYIHCISTDKIEIQKELENIIHILTFEK